MHRAAPIAAALGCAGAILLASPALAERELSGDEVRQLVTGKRIYLATPLGGELPLFYQPNGVVSGDGQAIGLGRFFAPRDTGRWFITGNRLCQQFRDWYNGERLCFSVKDLGNNRIRWVRDNGERGLARVGN